MLEEFKKYVNEFDMTVREISYKYEHSIRVMKISEQIAKSEGFSEHEVELAKVIGLLHDYARFVQWAKYNTFNDSLSIDHGDEAVRLLKENNRIKDFWNNVSQWRRRN